MALSIVAQSFMDPVLRASNRFVYEYLLEYTWNFCSTKIQITQAGIALRYFNTERIPVSNFFLIETNDAMLWKPKNSYFCTCF